MLLFDDLRNQTDLLHYFDDDRAYLNTLIQQYKPGYQWRHFFWGASRRSVKRLIKHDRSELARAIRQQLHQTDRTHWYFLRSMWS